MKKLLLLLLLIPLYSSQSMAQQTYYYAKNLDAYVGTWVYQNADTTFTLVIKKGTKNTSLFYEECLIGGYKLEKGEELIGDYTRNLPNEITDQTYRDSNEPSFIGTNGTSIPDRANPNVINIWFYDKNERHLKGLFILKTPTTARFKVRKLEQVILLEEGQTVEDPDISVPEDVIMTKVE